ncbi:MAG: FecR domain-containing protein [Bacteroidota bacterium]
MKENLYISLLQKQLAGSLTQEEKGQLDIWLQASEANQRFAEDVRNAWELGGHYPDPGIQLDLDAEFGLLEAKIEQFEQEKGKIRRFQRLPLWSKIAASILIVAGIALAIRSLLSPTSPTQWQEIHSFAEANELVELPDGSKVWLSSHSSLRFPSSFDASDRLVELKGRGYFDIAHLPNQAFVVQTASAEVRVLGTKFEVRDQEGDSLLSVQVVEGKVAVHSLLSDHTQVLTQQQRLAIHKTNKTATFVPEASPNAIAWHTNEFVFQDTPLGEVVQSLQTNFGLIVRIEAAGMQDCPLTVQQHIKDPRTFLENIADVFAMELREEGSNHYSLNGGSCQ